MSLKTRRQVRIMEIIRDQIVETQEDLAGRLQREGIPVTQATVSRDIKEMHKAEMVIAPAITTEGKFWQMTQGT